MRKLLAFLLFLPFIAHSQLPSITAKTKEMQAYPGFLNFYWDDKNGKLFLEINKVDVEMLYQTSMPAALGSNDIGLDRGLLGSTSIIKFNRTGNKVLMIQPNYAYRAITDNAPEKLAVEQSFAQSVLWGFTVEAEDKGAVLIDATAFLLRDAMQVTGRLSTTRQGNYSPDISRSALYLPSTKNFPLNTELEATISFVTKDANPGNWVATVTPSPEAISLRIHHSFVQLPDNNYKPRKFDPRSGYIPISYFDYSTPVPEPIEKYFIIRHRLEKKDPGAAISEAVKPIVYYLDNGTPEPIRSALLEGAQWWNQAFEAAGYRDAFQVKMLPVGADPMDVRYNVINWVHRSTRGWSYGASVVDPRTGEILKGHVSLGSLRVRQDYLIAEGLLAPYKNGITADDKMLKMALQRLKQLSAHEVGHTLGLMHNYIASTQRNASVMDYPVPSAFIDSKGDISLDSAYSNWIGDWDKVTIAYGYQDFPPGTNETAALDDIIRTAGKNNLTFISDRDARDPAGLHPKAHLWDAGKDPIANLDQVVQVRAKALDQFGIHNIRDKMPLSMLEDVLVPVYLFHRYQVEAVSKIVGGMEYTYALKGDGQFATRPVPKQEELRALKAILRCLQPAFLAIPEDISKLIPPRPAGYEYNRELFKRRTGLAFDALAAAETAADLPLSLLLQPARLNRMAEHEAIHQGLGIDEMMEVLMANTWKAPRLKGLQGMILQQNEQLLLTYLLRVYMSDNASFATKAATLQAITAIKDIASRQIKLAGSRKGYFLMTLDRIEEKDKAKPFVPLAIPPGAPIGCD